jgi:hypothetical protein
MTSLIHNPNVAGGNGLGIALGLYPGASGFYSLSGRDNVNQKAQGVDLWHGVADQLPTPPSGGEQMTLVSTSADDDKDAGIGTRSVEIHYIDAAGDQQIETVELEGLTPVSTIATDIRFVNFLHSASVGSNGVAVGDVSIYKFGDALTVYNMIQAGGNMSLTTSRMIPAGRSFYLTRWNATSTSQNKAVTLRIRATSDNGVLLSGIFLFKDSATLEVATYARTFSVPIKIPALAIIKVSAWALQVGTNVSASFDGFLIPN